MWKNQLQDFKSGCRNTITRFLHNSIQREWDLELGKSQQRSEKRLDFDYTQKVEPTGFAGRLYVGCERKREIKDCILVCGLNNLGICSSLSRLGEEKIQEEEEGNKLIFGHIKSFNAQIGNVEFIYESEVI